MSEDIKRAYLKRGATIASVAAELGVPESEVASLVAIGNWDQIKSSNPQSKANVDWLIVEKEYTAGIRPLRDIAAEAGITETSIRKRAKRDGWSRDLTNRIHAKAEPKTAAKQKKTYVRPQAVRIEVDEMASQGFVYCIYFTSGGDRFYKVGLSSSPISRLQSHQTSSPFELFIAICYFVPNMRAEERILHEAFAAKSVRGEWFTLDESDLDLMASRARLI